MIDVSTIYTICDQRAEQERQRADDLINEFARCSQWLQAALDHNIETTHSLNDICKGIFEGRYQFWPEDDAAMVTEIIEFPKARHLHGFLAGGNLETIQATIPKIEEFAKASGCTAATIMGRPGWTKALKDMGYGKGLVMTAKVFNTLDGQ